MSFPPKNPLHDALELAQKMISALDQNTGSRMFPNELSQTTAEKKLSEIQSILDNASEETDSQKLKAISNIIKLS